MNTASRAWVLTVCAILLLTGYSVGQVTNGRAPTGPIEPGAGGEPALVPVAAAAMTGRYQLQVVPDQGKFLLDTVSGSLYALQGMQWRLAGTLPIEERAGASRPALLSARTAIRAELNALREVANPNNDAVQRRVADLQAELERIEAQLSANSP